VWDNPRNFSFYFLQQFRRFDLHWGFAAAKPFDHLAGTLENIGKGSGSRLNLESSLHVGMEAAIIVHGAGLLQDVNRCLVRRHHHIKVAVPCRGGMGEHILVDPFDGIADFG